MTIYELREGLARDMRENMFLCYWFGEEGLKILIESLDKRIHQKVIRQEDCGHTTYRCGCGKELYLNQRRCDKCGQTQDWIEKRVTANNEVENENARNLV